MVPAILYILVVGFDLSLRVRFFYSMYLNLYKFIMSMISKYGINKVLEKD